MKTIISFCFYIILLLLTGCAPTATVIGTQNPPSPYAFTPGFNPPQVEYTDVHADSDAY